MPWKYSGKILKEGRSWKDNDGVAHPANWAVAWSAEEKAAKGLTFEAPPEPFDNRFYWGRNADGSLIPKNLDDVAEVDENGQPVLDEKGQQVITKGLRTQLIEKVKQQAGDKLRDTDWMIIRATEIPAKPPSTAVTQYRMDVRNASNQIEAAISVCGTIEDIIMLHTVPTDAEGNPTGNAPIADWPEA